MKTSQRGGQGMSGFPASPWFAGANTPSRAEVGVDRLKVIGAVPREIGGAFYRVAADQRFPPKYADDIPFNGDGMIVVFRFHDGNVDLQSHRGDQDTVHLKPAYHGNWFGASHFNPYRCTTHGVSHV